jgi:hypothetical protein
MGNAQQGEGAIRKREHRWLQPSCVQHSWKTVIGSWSRSNINWELCSFGLLVRMPNMTRLTRRAYDEYSNLDVDLLRIRTEADYDRALARANELMDIAAAKGTDTPEAAELDILTDVIEHYESRHWPV